MEKSRPWYIFWSKETLRGIIELILDSVLFLQEFGMHVDIFRLAIDSENYEAALPLIQPFVEADLTPKRPAFNGCGEGRTMSRPWTRYDLQWEKQKLNVWGG